MPRRNIFNYPDLKLAENLRKLCADKGLMHKDLAKVCQKERKSAMNWCNEYSSPSAWDIIQICLEYNISADELLSLKKEMNNDGRTYRISRC